MPLKISQFIQLLDNAIQHADNSVEKKKVLGKLFDPMSFGKDAELDPNDPLGTQQARDILERLVKLTAIETKASYATRTELRGARLKALEKIALWAASGSTTSPIFARVGRLQVAVQMALRVRKPSSMNQGPQGFCGPASVLVPFLRDNPVGYVSFVCGLFDSGMANLGTTQVDVRNAGTFLGGWQASCGPEADYVALGSLRANIEAVVDSPSGGGQTFSFLDTTTHATTPQQIAELLTQAGYGKVKNCALTDFTTTRDAMRLVAAGISLNNCANLLSSRPGSIVIMLVHPNLATNAKRKAQIKGDPFVPKLADLHWILVRKMQAGGLYINPPKLEGRVGMKLYTWKWSGLADFALSDFLPRYYGYISAEPA